MVSSTKNRLFVGNLSFAIDEQGLRNIFSQYGEIAEVKLPTDRETGRLRGFGFVTFVSDADAQNALEQDGKEYNGRAIRVSFTHDKPERPAGARGGFGGGNRGGFGGGSRGGFGGGSRGGFGGGSSDRGSRW